MFPAPSVSNSHNPQEWIQVSVYCATEPLKYIYHMKNQDRCIWTGFQLKIRLLQSQIFHSNSVFEFWLYCDMIYTWIVQFSKPIHLRDFDLASEQNS